MSDTVFDIISDPGLRSRAEVFDALDELSAYLERLRTRTGDATTVDDDARTMAARVAAALDAGVMDTAPGDAFEAARLRRVMASALAGGDAALLADRATYEPLFELWLDATRSPRERPHRWREAPGLSFPDIPTLRVVQIEVNARHASPDRDGFFSRLRELAAHIGDDDRFASTGVWEWRLLMLSRHIAATLRSGEPAAELTIGEIARAERVFAALAEFELFSADDVVALVTDPDRFNRWRADRAAQEGGLIVQRHHALVAEVHRARSVPISTRALVDSYQQQRPEFTDCPGLVPLNIDDHRSGVRGLAGLRGAVNTVHMVAAEAARAVGGERGRLRARVQRLATPILVTTTNRDRGGLSTTQAAQLERVLASLVALEPTTLAQAPGRLWQLISHERDYEQWLDERNAAEFQAQRKSAGIDPSVRESYQWLDNLASARARLDDIATHETEYEQRERSRAAEDAEFYRGNPDFEPEDRYEQQLRQAAEDMEPDWDAVDRHINSSAERVVADPSAAAAVLGGFDGAKWAIPSLIAEVARRGGDLATLLSVHCTDTLALVAGHCADGAALQQTGEGSWAIRGRLDNGLRVQLTNPVTDNAETSEHERFRVTLLDSDGGQLGYIDAGPLTQRLITVASITPTAIADLRAGVHAPDLPSAITVTGGSESGATPPGSHPTADPALTAAASGTQPTTARTSTRLVDAPAPIDPTAELGTQPPPLSSALPF
ncbi:hypothetical protein ACQP2U_43395 (plasmid) [Nocardia sp. CA-084685]|uniref:hypothetical protein n=1 Tax=Nocardia sp. CA-084685 TaxID=3239970 RepID=UPI003D982CF9